MAMNFTEAGELEFLPDNLRKIRLGRNDRSVEDALEGWCGGCMSLLYPIHAERTFKGYQMTDFARSIYLAAPVAVLLYLAFLWIGPRLMAGREPIRLKKASAAWNLFLAVFSLLGTMRLAPQVMLELWYYGVVYTLCRSAEASYGEQASGLWAFFFIYSKFAELGDTFFLVLAKKEVAFLHWFHHCTVLLYTWLSYIQEAPNGQYFMAMNYAVHTAMYYYYYLTARGYRPSWAMAVTVVQISQMVFGIIITGSAWVLSERVSFCATNKNNLFWASLMYTCYLLLFLQFFFKRYCVKRNGKDTENRKKQS